MIGSRAIGKRQGCELLESWKRPVETSGAAWRISRPARPVTLAAKVPGIVAALLIALIAACTNEMHFTPPPISPLTQPTLAIPATPTPAPVKVAAVPLSATPTATPPATAAPWPPTPIPTQGSAATAIPTATGTPPPPPAADTPRFVQLSAGPYGGCGLREDGQVFCRGRDYQRGPDLTDTRFRQISLGQYYACGLRRDGTIACWGDSEHSQTTPPPGPFIAVAAGRQHACALDTAGYAHCWGRDKDGRATPPAGVAFTAIAAGGIHSCGLTVQGALHCWGNNFGQPDFHSGPFQSLALGTRHTCALRPEGAAWCQGDNNAGQASPPPGAFTHIAAGEKVACGLRPGGRLECWGGGFGAELEAPAGKFTTISAGGNTFCALTAGGYPRCWQYLWNFPQIVETKVEFAAVTPEPARRQPVELFPWPRGGLAVVEREGLILLCPGDALPCAGDEMEPLLDLTDRTDLSAAESGMLSAAPDPDFDRFPFLYAYYTTTEEPRKVRLSRFPVAAGQVDRAGELIILELLMPNNDHFGGAIRFGPDDLLYLGIGDNKFPEAPQDLGSLRGKIIRIAVRGAAPEQPYRIPADNPFQDTEGARPEIWAYGLRNPWRMSFDTAGRLWVGDVGGDVSEEVSMAKAGANLGWPVFEGDFCFAGAAQCAALTAAIPPVVTYGHKEGCAIIWGGQYRGTAVPSLAGAQIFGDYCSGRVWALTPDGKGGWQKRLVATLGSPILSFGTDAAGEMYALSIARPPLKLGPPSWAVPGAENPAAGP